MKYLIMCEGPNELEIIRLLLEHEQLIITEDDLLNLIPYLSLIHIQMCIRDSFYSFSTGDRLDSMAVAGTVLNAANLEPVKGMRCV